jgi:hypothetical protein
VAELYKPGDMDMHTLFESVSSVNKVQYGLALLFVFGFVIMNEIIKPRPFQGFLKSAADDVGFVKAQGKEKLVRLVRNTAMAPVYVLLYLSAVPFLFFRSLAASLGEATSLGWSPVRAYFTGRRKAKKGEGDKKG